MKKMSQKAEKKTNGGKAVLKGTTKGPKGTALASLGGSSIGSIGSISNAKISPVKEIKKSSSVKVVSLKKKK